MGTLIQPNQFASKSALRGAAGHGQHTPNLTKSPYRTLTDGAFTEAKKSNDVILPFNWVNSPPNTPQIV